MARDFWLQFVRRGCVRAACPPIEPNASDRTNTPPRRAETPAEAPLRQRVPAATHNERERDENAAQDYRKENDSDPTVDRPAAGRPERAESRESSAPTER